MTEKSLGKITSASFGFFSDCEYMFGLILEFKLGLGSGVGSGTKYMVNMSPDCNWESSLQRQEAIERLNDFVYKTLNDANVSSVHGLIGKPVEVETENRWFKDFRILTEVI